jgi:hypothetical protein
MKLLENVYVRVVILAIVLSAGIYFLYDPGVEAAASTVLSKIIANDNISATWQRAGNVLIDEDGDKFRCENPDAPNPSDMGCAIMDQPTQTNLLKLNPHLAVQNAQGQWLIFERKGDHEIIDANGTIWTCANRDGATTLADMGCTRSG